MLPFELVLPTFFSFVLSAALTVGHHSPSEILEQVSGDYPGAFNKNTTGSVIISENILRVSNEGISFASAEDKDASAFKLFCPAASIQLGEPLEELVRESDEFQLRHVQYLVCTQTTNGQLNKLHFVFLKKGNQTSVLVFKELNGKKVPLSLNMDEVTANNGGLQRLFTQLALKGLKIELFP